MATAYQIINQDQLMKISEREIEVLYLIAYEYSNRQISSMLHISINTVDTYRRKLLLKFGANNAAGLIRRAYEENIFPMSQPTFINGVPPELI